MIVHVTKRIELRHLNFPCLLTAKMICTDFCRGSRDLQIQPSGIKLAGHQSSVLCCLDEHKYPKDLAIHLQERAPETLAKVVKIADQYLEAHGKHLSSPVSRKPEEQLEVDEAENTQFSSTAIQCFKCNTCGHKAVNCPTRTKSCFLCGKQGHEARNC